MSKTSKLVSTCLSCLLFVLPSLSYALGLGDLKISTYLNEPLEATIPLDDVKGIEPSDILTTMADLDEYAKAGYEAANWIYHIQFTVVPDKQGKMVIKLTTQRPVQEPFADLLVKVTWPGGKILREYTLLLDPPKIVKSQAKISVSRSNEFIKSLSSPADESQAPRMVAQAVKHQYKEIRSDVSSDESLRLGGRYGPVHGEFLWRIGRRLVEGTPYSVYQAVMAIASKNPDAFVNGNINQIKQGAYLNMPSQNEISAYSQAKAIQFVENQGRNAQAMPLQTIKNDQKEQKEQKEQKNKIEGKQEEKHKALKLIAPTQEIVNSTQNTVPVPSTAGNNTNEKTQATQSPIIKEAASQQLSLAEEALDTLKRSNDEIKQKNSQLQSQNQSLAELLALKEAELNKLKSTEKTQSQSVAPSKENPSKSIQPVQEYAVVTPEPDTHKAITEQNNLPANAAPMSGKNKENKQPNVAKEDKSANAVPTVYAPTELKGKYVFILFIIAFTVSILGWLWFSRHRFIVLAKWLTNKFNQTKTMLPRKEASSLDSDLPQEEIQVNYGLQFDLEKALSAVAKEEKKYSKTQTISTLAKEDQEAIRKKSLTALEDAEIYIAYERYQQAEKILQEILTTQTSHDEIYWEGLLKLLELYVLTENYQEYEKWYATVPNELKDIAPKVWSKIMLLQEKVQAEKAIPSQMKDMIAQPKAQEDELKLSLAEHHITEIPDETSQSSPEPELAEQVATPKFKLELIEKDNDEFNAQIALAQTYQNVGDNVSAKEVLEKMLERTTDDKEKELLQKMIADLNNK